MIFYLKLLHFSVFHRPAYGVYLKLEFQTRNKIIVFNGILVTSFDSLRNQFRTFWAGQILH